MTTREELTGRVVYRRFGVTKDGRPFVRVGIEDGDRTVYASIWSDAGYWTLAPKLVKGTTVKVAGKVDGDNLNPEPGSWKVR